jgi:Zn ribbon nucleic-acid-binding protein
MPRADAKAKQRDRRRHRFKIVGRVCKWCEKTDEAAAKERGFISERECVRCYERRKQSCCHTCGGPWYVKGGCVRKALIPTGMLCVTL